MKAIGFKTALPIDSKDSFVEFEIAKPKATGHELLVKIEAVSVNPVDYKVRQGGGKDTVFDPPKIIGWDAAGTIEAIGDLVSLFKVGDKVYYAGDITKQGSNAEYHTIDERIVGSHPTTLSSEEAAVMALTGLTAWELMFDRIRINPEKDKGKSILIIGGAGGVGSIAIQLAKKIADLKVIATASRPESVEWCKKQGADVVVDHTDLINNVHNAGFEHVDYILDFVDINQYWDAFVELIKPQGHIGSISDPKEKVNLLQLKGKSVSFHWELMFTRSKFETEDMIEQHHILNKLAELLDQGTIKTTINTSLKGFTVENFKEAHRLLESGKAIGKIAILY